MKKIDVLYAVQGRGHTGTLIKPINHQVLNSDKTLRRIVLARTIEDAFYLTYPKAYLEKWAMATIKAYGIVPEKRHSIHGPEFLEKAFGFNHAVEHGEYACFSNLRMQEVGTYKLIQASKLNEDLIDESGNIYGKRFALF